MSITLKPRTLICSIIYLSVALALPASAMAPTEPLVPQNIVDSLLAKYSDQEKKLILMDLKNIGKLCFFEKKPNGTQPAYIATCGGPGSLKSTILEKYFEAYTQPAVYIDPDQRALRFMSNTYHQSLALGGLTKHTSYHEALINAYDTWRGGSNYIANTLLNEAFDQRYNIFHGTTSTSDQIDQLYKKLKAANYKIVLILCFASDDTRLQAVTYRAITQAFVQSSTNDFASKQKAFLSHIPTYLAFTDEIHLFWADWNDEQKTAWAYSYYAQDKKLQIEEDVFEKCNALYNSAKAANTLTLREVLEQHTR